MGYDQQERPPHTTVTNLRWNNPGLFEVTAALPTGLKLQLTLTLEVWLNWDKHTLRPHTVVSTNCKQF